MKFDIKKFNPCREGLKYYERQSSFEEAWNNCPRGDWMLWIASRLRIGNRTLTRAKALCANTVRDLIKNKRSTDAIDASLRYADGEISREELEEVVCSYDDYDASSAAAIAYANVAYAADADANAVYAAIAAKKANQLATANICRKVLTEAVFDKIHRKREFFIKNILK